ncbi:MAG: hypothetical protein IM613_05915, partial [Cytophagales bacterium]|nr:hypothetical protein [Cytophagales bacterium]
MKHFTIFTLWLVATLVYSQPKHTFTRTSFSKEISFIRFDSAQAAQSTVIEYPKFLVVIELPMIEEGAGRSTNLEEDIPKAEKYLSYLEEEYRKPVKYVLSSHWHLHSLSGITPFFNNGAKLVVAKTNWKYSLDNGLLNSQDVSKFNKQVVSITRDTTLLSDTKNPIDVLFLDKSYTFKPTKDYLFFYLPASKTMHASCMCAMANIDFKQRPEFVYNDRVSDLEKAIATRKLKVENLIKLSAEYDKETKAYKPVTFTNSYFSEFKQRGTPLHVVVKNYSRCSLEKLTRQRDSILHHLVDRKISLGIINSAVYDCIREKQFINAVEWARLLNLYSVGDNSYIDT